MVSLTQGLPVGSTGGCSKATCGVCGNSAQVGLGRWFSTRVTLPPRDTEKGLVPVLVTPGEKMRVGQGQRCR